ncbi:multiheme c-type cytochrome [Leptospira ellisii]|uniref:Multiheme c-type cytochrome n=2 Tax=Leptospira ellisii TaxID=2023197 RepID=A0AAE4QLB1_9LEPT|nr:multiheme c-type cytochrome [Leptospira ellisii]MDV6235143.1 multiheme c-type cytochrome [Leptospira ellisii]
MKSIIKLYFLNILISRFRFFAIVSGLLVSSISLYVCGRSAEDPIPLEKMFPDRAWAKPIRVPASLPGISGLKAEDCGRCHEDHWKEWRISTHANALGDLQFQAELSKPNSPRWLCLNCHTPLSGQRESIATHLENGDVFRPIFETNPKYDPVWEKEGVTCGTCHLKADEQGRITLIGPTGAAAPHPVEKNREALHARCNDCHNQEYKLNASLVCYFRTGEEYKESVHLGKEDCVSCHMPSVSRSVVIPSFNKSKRDSHRHTFVGGGVPKTFPLFDAHWKNGYRSGLEISRPVWSETAQDTIRVRVELSNRYAGHHVPTGDPERHVLVEGILLNETGKEIAKIESRIGQIWEWYPEAKLVSDNRIRSGETRTVELALPKKRNEKPRYGIVRIKHVRLTKENSQHMKKNANLAPKPIAQKLKRIETEYPFANLFYEAVTDFSNEKTVLKTEGELLHRSKNGNL